MKKNKAKKLISLIFALRSNIFKKMENVHAKLGAYTVWQLMALLYIKENGNAQMKDLASHLGIKPPSATSIVNNLVNKKLIKKAQDKDDSRSTLLSITPSGNRFFNAAAKHVFIQAEKIFSSLNSKEQDQLINLYSKLLNNLKK